MDNLEYLADILMELRKFAEPYETLGYFIDLAAAEAAEELVRQQARQPCKISMPLRPARSLYMQPPATRRRPTSL